MKIGILTLMHGHNYGGVLQCYALQKKLTELGHDVEVIDFHPNPRWRKVFWALSLTGAKVTKRIVDILGKRKFGDCNHENFENFRQQHLKMSQPCNSRKELVELAGKYDALITGSDQVWNFDWFTPEYFLDFSLNLQVKRFSYAACFGHAGQTRKFALQAEECFRAFDKISVRNSVSQNIVKQICGRTADIVVDPTLLIDFKSLEEMPALPYEKYILLYAMSEKRLLRQMSLTEILKKKFRLPVVAVKSTVLQPWNMDFVDYCVIDPKVEEWIGLIRKASFVLTDSFHGTLFSVRAQVPFMNYIGNDPGAERVSYITERYGLGAGFPGIEDLKEGKGGYVGDFVEVNNKINTHIQESLKFLDFFKKG